MTDRTPPSTCHGNPSKSSTDNTDEIPIAAQGDPIENHNTACQQSHEARNNTATKNREPPNNDKSEQQTPPNHTQAEQKHNSKFRGYTVFTLDHSHNQDPSKQLQPLIAIPQRQPLVAPPPQSEIAIEIDTGHGTRSRELERTGVLLRELRIALLNRLLARRRNLVQEMGGGGRAEKSARESQDDEEDKGSKSPK